MTADTDSADDGTSGGDTGASVGHDLEADRTTAPMSEFSIREVGIGFLVLAVGIAISYGVPLVV